MKHIIVINFFNNLVFSFWHRTGFIVVNIVCRNPILAVPSVSLEGPLEMLSHICCSRGICHLNNRHSAVVFGYIT